MIACWLLDAFAAVDSFHSWYSVRRWGCWTQQNKVTLKPCTSRRISDTTNWNTFLSCGTNCLVAENSSWMQENINTLLALGNRLYHTNKYLYEVTGHNLCSFCSDYWIHEISLCTASPYQNKLRLIVDTEKVHIIEHCTRYYMINTIGSAHPFNASTGGPDSGHKLLTTGHGGNWNTKARCCSDDGDALGR